MDSYGICTASTNSEVLYDIRIILRSISSKIIIEKIVIRFNYNWGAEDNTMSFTGVGYVLLEELLTGFNN